MTEEQMTIERAIRLLHPETTAEALAEIKCYHGLHGRVACVQAVSDACEFACEIMQDYKETKDALERIREAEEWKDARKEPPDQNQRVLYVLTGKERACIGRYHGVGPRGGHYFMNGNRLDSAWWWKPEPELPKE